MGPTEVRVLEMTEIAKTFSHLFRQECQTCALLAQLFILGIKPRSIFREGVDRGNSEVFLRSIGF
jgi:hypothetical protein